MREEIAPGLATVGRLASCSRSSLLSRSTDCGTASGARAPGLAVLAALGFTGGGLHLALQWLGLHYTTATSGVLYLSMSPIFILVMAAPLGERIGPRQWTGVAISFCGVYLIATQGRLAVPSFNVGDMMALASMMMWAGYTVLLRVRRDPLSTIELLVMVCAFGVVFMLPWVGWDLPHNPRVGAHAGRRARRPLFGDRLASSPTPAGATSCAGWAPRAPGSRCISCPRWA